MLKKIHGKVHEHLAKSSRNTKSIVALTLLLMLFFVAISLQQTPSETESILVDEYLSTIELGKTYIMNDTLYTAYNGSNLAFQHIRKTCENCYVINYSFDVTTDKLLKSITGFRAIVEINGDQVTSAKYVRILN